MSIKNIVILLLFAVSFSNCYLLEVSKAEPVDLYVKGRAIPLSYQQQLAGWLSKFQFYPATAKKLNIEGTVLVKVSIKSDGTILKSGIEKSSGSDILDQAALQLLDQATPLPAFPDRFEADEITFIAPITYNLNPARK